MDAERYKGAWTQENTLEELNKRIHDGAQTPEELLERARKYRRWLIESSYPHAAPPVGGSMMEFGSGVGWIMQAMLERYDVKEIIGLDISEVMIRGAKERLSDERAKFVLYDGFHFPFDDDRFDNIYSAACIQHINKDISFGLFKEMHRCLKPGGHATLHVLSLVHPLYSKRSFEEEARRHLEEGSHHHHYFYTAEELLIWLVDFIGVSDFDLRSCATSLIVHFSKGGASQFARPELEAKVRFRPNTPAAPKPA